MSNDELNTNDELEVLEGEIVEEDEVSGQVFHDDGSVTAPTGTATRAFGLDPSTMKRLDIPQEQIDLYYQVIYSIEHHGVKPDNNGSWNFNCNKEVVDIIKDYLERTDGGNPEMLYTITEVEVEGQPAFNVKLEWKNWRSKHYKNGYKPIGGSK
jgi:hypothetical protein